MYWRFSSISALLGSASASETLSPSSLSAFACPTLGFPPTDWFRSTSVCDMDTAMSESFLTDAFLAFWEFAANEIEHRSEMAAASAAFLFSFSVFTLMERLL